jgi:hypothetical protein
MSAAAGTRDVSVITEGGTGTLAGGFTVNEGPLGALFIAMVWVGIAVALAALWWVLRILRRRRAASL